MGPLQLLDAWVKQVVEVDARVLQVVLPPVLMIRNRNLRCEAKNDSANRKRRSHPNPKWWKISVPVLVQKMEK